VLFIDGEVIDKPRSGWQHSYRCNQAVDLSVVNAGLLFTSVRYWPISARHDVIFLVGRPAAPRREQSFKDGLTEQMNSFDEGPLLAESGRS